MSIINLMAIVVIPIVAVIIGQMLQNRAQKRNDKIQIFKILMTSRIYGWTPEIVQALNLLEIVFADDKAVCEQWKVYYDKLCVENPTDTELSKIKKEKDRLLEIMAKSLGYKNITLATIQSPYIPKGMTDQMAQQQKYQTDQSLIMEQMKNMMKTNGKDEINGQTKNANSKQS